MLHPTVLITQDSGKVQSVWGIAAQQPNRGCWRTVRSCIEASDFTGWLPSTTAPKFAHDFCLRCCLAAIMNCQEDLLGDHTDEYPLIAHVISYLLHRVRC